MVQDDFPRAVPVSWHYPAVIVGLLLIGSYCVLLFYVQFRVMRAGYVTWFVSSVWKWFAPVAAFKYLSVRKNHGWSPWPVYLLWLSLAGGVILLAFGLIRLVVA